MPRTTRAWRDVAAVLDAQERIATHAQLIELGMPKSSVMHRIRVDGSWQRLLPGVVLAHRGTPTRRERLLGALAYAGAGAVISGTDALVAAGLREIDVESTVLVLIAADRHRQSFEYVHIERTRRPPQVRLHRGLPFALPARAVIDLCRHQHELSDVRACVAAAVQQRKCTVQALGAELRSAPRQRTSRARRALEEVADGVHSVAEARAREILERADLPQPQWNATLVDAQGVPFLRPDAWWPTHGAALEIDSRKWHLSPDDWARTQKRQRLLTARGIFVMSFSPTEILAEPENFVREVKSMLKAPRQGA